MISNKEIKRRIFRMYNHGHSSEVIAEKLELDLKYVKMIIDQYEKNKQGR